MNIIELLSINGLNHHFCSFLPQKDLVNLLCSKEVIKALSTEAKVRQLFYKIYILPRTQPLKQLSNYISTSFSINEFKNLAQIVFHPLKKLFPIENITPLNAMLVLFKTPNFSDPQTYLQPLAQHHSQILSSINQSIAKTDIPLETNSSISVIKQLTNLISIYNSSVQKEFLINILHPVTSIITFSFALTTIYYKITINIRTILIFAIFTTIVSAYAISLHFNRFSLFNQKIQSIQTQRDQILNQNTSLDQNTIDTTKNTITFDANNFSIETFKIICTSMSIVLYIVTIPLLRDLMYLSNSF